MWPAANPSINLYNRWNHDTHVNIFFSKGFKPNQEFMEESLKIYDSVPAALTDMEEINEWVEKSTNGYVTEFLSSLPPNLVMMLINAVHYKGNTITAVLWYWTSSYMFEL